MKFPVDAPRLRVVRALRSLAFEIVREREHIAMIRRNVDGTTTLTMPNHQRINGSTLRAICFQAGIDRDEFLRAYERSRGRCLSGSLIHRTTDGLRRRRTTLDEFESNRPD